MFCSPVIAAGLLGISWWGAAVMLVCASGLALVLAFYKRCPSNRILVIFGRTKNGDAPLCMAGGARWVVPIWQDYAWLSLEPMRVEVTLRGALTSENIRVNVSGLFTVAIGRTPELMQDAATRLLKLGSAEIGQLAEGVISGELRRIVASMRIEEIARDRSKFLANIHDSLAAELRKLGLELINANLADVTDESGYMEALGQKAAAEAIQKAQRVETKDDAADTNRSDGAAEEKDGAAEEKSVQAIGPQRMRSIGRHAPPHARATRVAELDNREQTGDLVAAFERETRIKEAEREMRIKLAEADARAIEGENAAKADVAASQAALQVKKAEAFLLGETKKAEAEAAVLETEHLAREKVAEAEARRVEAKRRAELEAPAKAEKAKIEMEAQAAAAKRRIEAEGDAAAIFAKLEAEARGQYELLARKAEGLRQIVEACGGAQDAFQLLLLDHFDNLVEASAKAISNIKFDKIVVWDPANAENGSSATATWLSNMARTLPPMMQVLKDIGGVELPETLANLAMADQEPESASA